MPDFDDQSTASSIYSELEPLKYMSYTGEQPHLAYLDRVLDGIELTIRSVRIRREQSYE